MTELNERLARWAGFRHEESNLWLSPDGVGVLSQHEDSLPPEANFTDPDLGIAYCFKWLVPKLVELGFDDICLHLVKDAEGYYAECFKRRVGEDAYAESPALALCLAIDKLIDSEVKE